MLEIFILGCGGTQPLYYRHLSSILVRKEGQSFLFDCGEGTQVSLKRQKLRWKNISNIFVSHSHSDHVTGIPGLMMLSSQVERIEPLQIFAPKSVCNFIANTKKDLDIYINYPLELKPVQFPQRSEILYEDSAVCISCFPLMHSVATVGFLIEEKASCGSFSPESALSLSVPQGPLWGLLQSGKTVQNIHGKSILPEQVLGASRPGQRLAFMTDTLYDASFAKYIQGVDLLICEGMFARNLKENAHEKKHMTAEEAAMLAMQGEVKKLALTHFSPRYLNRDLHILLKEAQCIFPNTVLCQDSGRFVLPDLDSE